MRFKNCKAFSMVELTIVLTLISILLLIAYSSFDGSKNESTQANLKSSLDAVTSAEELNYSAKNDFETDITKFSNLVTFTDTSKTFTFVNTPLNIVSDLNTLSVAKTTDGSGTNIFGIAGTTGVECLLSQISVLSDGITWDEKFSTITEGECSGTAAVNQ
jgi:prepilin-type N-terminal cleavage/methylation domain-containing protein